MKLPPSYPTQAQLQASAKWYEAERRGFDEWVRSSLQFAALSTGMLDFMWDAWVERAARCLPPAVRFR